MASLKTTPNSSTAKQHQTLVVAARRKGIDLAELRGMVGGSLCALSAADCSSWITRIADRELANPPGEKPSVYKTRPTPGATRVITKDQIDQIDRLGIEYFGDMQSYTVWLRRNFKVDTPRDLATAKRGGQVLAVLKAMIRRRDLNAARLTEPGARATGSSSSQPKGPSHAV